MAYDDAHFGDNTTYWEKVASTSWGTSITDIEKRAILKAHDFSRRPAGALEIGAEGGRWSKLLTDLGWSMICTDIDDKTLAVCMKRVPTSSCILVSSDDNKLPCGSESVRLLLCIEVAPVIQADWFTSEAFRVLQNDGLIVGVFWNLLSLRGFLAHARSLFTGNFDYYKLYYPFWRRKLLCRGSGYSILYEEGYCWFPFRRDSNSVFVPYFVRLEKWLGLRKLTLISPWIVFIARKSSKGHLAANREGGQDDDG